MSFSRTSIGNIDLNLLSVLVALVEERSTVGAARRLRLAQSTVSGTLAKLREIFDDELLFRNGRALEPTTRALELVEATKPHLEALSAAIGATQQFDPQSDEREFRIGCTDAVAFSILPELTQIIRTAAPNCILVVRVGDYRTLPSMLASGEITTAVGYFKNAPPATAKVTTLRHSPWVVIRDTAIAPIRDVEDFCERPHAIVTPMGNLNGFVDEKLKELGCTRRVVVGLSSFATLLATIPGSDLITTVPDFVAESFLRFADFEIDQCPVEIDKVVNQMSWSIVADRDASQQWLRTHIVSIFRKGASAG